MNIQKYNDTRIQYHCDTSDIFFLLFGRNKTKGSKQDNQNRLRSPMPEGGEP